MVQYCVLDFQYPTAADRQDASIRHDDPIRFSFMNIHYIDKYTSVDPEHVGRME